MKALNLLCLPALFALQTSFAQTSHVTLSDQYPTVGETINLTYDPTGTLLAGKDGIEGKVYFLDNKHFPVSDLEFKTDGGVLKSSFTVGDSVKSFYIKLYKDDDVDNNSDAGYVYLIYDKDKKPVAGAYATEAGMLTSGMGTSLAKIKAIKSDEGLALYKKEFELHPESMKDYAENYYQQLARSADPANKQLVDSKIAALEQSGTEKDLQTASNLYYAEKNRAASDSLSKVIVAKYPNGANAKFPFYIKFNSTTDLKQRDSIYNAFVQTFHPKPTDAPPFGEIMAAGLAEAYAKQGDWTNAGKYADMMQGDTYKPSTYNDVAYEMAKKGENLDEAAKLSKQSLDILQARIDNPKPTAYRSPADVKKSAQQSYNYYADTYALILFKQGKFNDALKYEQLVYDNTPKPLDQEEMEHYLLILNSLGKYKEAKIAAEDNVKAGKGSETIENELRTAYVKVNGGDKGYDQYLAGLQSVSKEKARQELAKQMINKPAPLFTLKDLDGKIVSLADLKGKVVIVDFWATWCGPCKASFPGMQLAVTKYKDDPNVKFLFVDCWENGDDFNVKGVKQFIADYKYSFHVLLDEKAEDGRQSKVNNTFDISGIPTKFIIDKNGNIRFKVVGFDGTSEQIAQEVSDMINMAANPPAQKVSLNN